MRTCSFVLAASLGLVLASACGSEEEVADGTADGGDGRGGPGFGDGDGGSADGAGACTTTSKKAERVPLDMVIALDTSFSMDFDDKWTNVRAALKSFVQNPAYAELGIGLQFFPIRKQCAVADYAKPAVALGLQPAVAGPIVQTLDVQAMAGGTPIVPLLQGLSAYLKASAKPGRKPVIVLATDGVPDDTCLAPTAGGLANTLDNAVSVAEAARNGTPSIATFVIGVGSELTALNAIAQAGGTGNAALVDTGANAEKAFLAALDGIRKQAIPCDFAIPAIGIDVSKTNVTYTPVGGAAQTFGFVGNEAGCAKAPDSGWYFDNDAAPTKVILCAGACDIVKKDDDGRVDVLFGCPRRDVR